MQAAWAIRTVNVAQNVTILRCCAAARAACGQKVANFGRSNSARNNRRKKYYKNAQKKTRIRLDRRVAILISFFDAYGRFGRFCTRPALALRCFGVARGP